MRKLRLLKFDTIHPQEFLKIKKEKWSDLETVPRKEYLERLIALRSNFSDFYTYNLPADQWEAEEFISNDDDYVSRVGKETPGFTINKEFIKDVLLRRGDRLRIIERYINKYKPDIIFSREHSGIPSSFWQRFRKHTLIVARLAAPMPHMWHPNDFDLIYTSTEEFRIFFSIT